MASYINKFEQPKHIEERILDGDGRKIGTIRIKPSGVLWKPRHDRKFYAVALSRFADWISSVKTGASRTAS
jgi:hypothetical protein